MRRVVVQVTPAMLANICRSTGEECMVLSIDGVPHDAKFITAKFNFRTDCFDVVFEHPSFIKTMAGCEYPMLNVIHTKYLV